VRYLPPFSKFKNPIQNLQTIEQLPTDLNNDLTYVFDGVSTIKKALNNRVVSKIITLSAPDKICWLR
jgi:hypothetical protein